MSIRWQLGLQDFNIVGCSEINFFNVIYVQDKHTKAKTASQS